MTGFVNTAPPASNLGVLLNGGGIPAGAPVTAPNALPFLDLLWLFGGEAPVDEPPVEEPLQQDSTPIDFTSTVVTATPQLVADALIRSMLSAGGAAPAPKADSAGEPEAPSGAADTEPMPSVPAAGDVLAASESETDSPAEIDDPDTLPELPVFAADFALDPPKPIPSDPASPTPPVVAGITLPTQETKVEGAVPRSLRAPAAPVRDAPPQPIEVQGAVSSTPVATRAQRRVAAPHVQQALPSAARHTTERAAPLAFALRLTANDRPTEEPRSPALPVAVHAKEPVAIPLVAPQPQLHESVVPAGEVALLTETPVVKPATESAPLGSETKEPAVKPVEEKQNGAEPDRERQGSGPQQTPSSKNEQAPAPKHAVSLPEFVPLTPAAPVVSVDGASVEAALSPRPTSNLSSIAAPDLPGPTQPIEAPPKPEAPTATAHEIAVRVSAPNEVPVDLHIAQRGGEVRVAVRTADPGLQTSLRQELGTLVDSLEHSGFRTETLVLQDTAPHVRMEGAQSFDLSSSFRSHALPSGGLDAGNAGNNDNSQNNDGSSQPQDQRESGARQQHHQRRQNSSQHLKWMKAMEEQS